MVEEEYLIDAVDGKKKKLTEGVFLSELNSRLQQIILHEHPNLTAQSFISYPNLAKYRLLFAQQVIDKANRKNDFVRETVFDVSKHQDYQALDVQEEWDSKVTFGQKVADLVARFGGSWTFIISFVLLMIVWMAFNVINPFGLSFDAYPFILLNLALSTLAAIQAPLIMMSQNRASDYDRLQAKNDYGVNRKSEEGIRLLHAKIDHLVLQDQSDLLEIQKLQTEMLADITAQLDTLERNYQVLSESLKNKEDKVE